MTFNEKRLGALGRRGGTGRRWPRRLLILTNVVVTILFLAAVSAYGYTTWRFGQINVANIKNLITTGHDAQSSGGSGLPPMTILVIGSDTRNLGSGASAAFGNQQEAPGSRSDTIILMRVVPATSSIALLSLPRDLLEPIKGLGTTRINSAYDTGGANLLVSTIESDFGIDVNHVVSVNFDSFRQIAQAIGGVEQYFPTPARDLYSGLSIPSAGCYNLTGNEALGFARSREYQYELNGSWHYQYVPESDLARIQRQQAFVKGAIKKAEKVGPTNLGALNGLISALTTNLTVDSSFSESLMLQLAQDFRHANVSGIPNWTYPTVNSTSVPGALDPSPEQDTQMVHQFLSYGQPTNKKSSGTTTSSLPNISPSSMTVKVLNGSGKSGQASDAASALRSAGFKVSSFGDNTSFNVTTTIIKYGSSESDAAKLLESAVGGGAVLQKDSSSPDALTLITGSSYTGVNSGSSSQSGSSGTSSASSTSAPGTSSPTTTPQVQTDSSSYWNGQYVPPGLQPGQTPQKCSNS